MDPRASSTKFFIFNRTNIVFSFLHFYLWKIFLHFSQDSFVLIKYKGEILEFVENNLKYYYYRFDFFFFFRDLTSDVSRGFNWFLIDFSGIGESCSRFLRGGLRFTE